MAALPEAERWNDDEVTALGKFLLETDSIVRMADAVGEAMSSGMAQSMGALQVSVEALVAATAAQEKAELERAKESQKKSRRLTRDGDDDSQTARVTYLGLRI